MPHSVFLNLIAKKLTGEASPEEIQQYESLLKANPEWAYQAEQIQNIFLSKVTHSQEESEQAFEEHLKKMRDSGISLEAPKQTPLRNRRKAFALSFIIIACVLLGFSFWISEESKGPIPLSKNYSEVISPVGSKTKLLLPDSTVVWLNAGSKLTYNEHFGATNRNTTLVGEAFFDVKKSHMPFIIHTNSIQIRVLGTAFNVKAYPDEKTTETSLLRGRVEITLDKRPGERYILKPNEKLIVANDPERIKAKESEKKEPIAVLSNVNHLDDTTVIETSWVDNKLVFEDESFDAVARKMERWYGVNISFADDKIANDHVYGSFTRETISEALDALKIGFHFNYKMEGNHIMIASK